MEGHVADALSEAQAFDQRSRERMAAGLIPDLRRAQPCDWFYNNPWRRPEYAEMIFGDYLGFALDHLPAPPARVLEVGCGLGYMTLELARNGYRVTGLDLSPDSIELAKATAETNPYRDGFGSLEYVCADFMDWSPNERFDAVCFFLTLHHFEDVDGVVAKIATFLAPGGHIVIAEPARDWLRPGDAAVAVLVRVLLSMSGGWFEPKATPGDRAELEAMVADCLREYREARDAAEGAQSPHDNSSFATTMLDVVRARFDETGYRASYSLLPRLVGGVRAPSESETVARARFLELIDRYLVESGVLSPGAFCFAGRLRGGGASA